MKCKKLQEFRLIIKGNQGRRGQLLMNEKITVGGDIFPIINFAMQQNYVPIIRNLILKNQTNEAISQIRLKITFEPQLARDYETTIDVLEPEVPVEIAPVRINLMTDYLLSLTEKMVGTIHIEVLEKEEKIFTKDIDIELLAYDQWSGALIMPEMICAFITPNHPRVTESIAKAGSYLQKWAGNPSFTGYQTGNPNVIKYQMASIYAALQAENIAYNMPPASYENIGQRVRFPNVVLEQKMGTCIDLAVLYAACLEAVGLNAIIIIIKGHAFCGCWLEEQCFSESVQDDVTMLSKRIAEGIEEICLVECTSYTAGSAVAFDKAIKKANEHLTDPSQFLLAVDVCRSRGSGIRPVPIRTVIDGSYQMIDYGERKESDITAAPEEMDLRNRVKQVESKELTKQKLWERKLLDLSLRNMLLSFRVTKNAVQLMAGNLATLEDALADGESFRILAKPKDWENTLRDSKIFEVENNKDAIEQLVQAEFKNKRIRTFLDETELSNRVKSLHRSAKISLEENGTNTLYLALGFLRWFETEVSERPRYAPIVLVPVEVVRKVQIKEYVLRIRDEEAQMNITLLEMLKQDFGLDIGGLDPLPTDQSGIDLKLVFTIMRQAVMGKKRWDVEELAFLGLFSFSQFIMWNDIRNRSKDLEQNKIVKSLISGKMEWIPEEAYITVDKLDEVLVPSEMAIPTSADSSQLVAICAAAKGQSFVLHGPPGTGKSQTITNIIANTLYQGKTVLFVAEKMAALTVVQKRLAAIGLDPFCLELHSNKACKRDVLSQLEKTLSVGCIKAPEEYEVKANDLHDLRQELNEVVKEIHEKRSYGMSLYEAITRYEENIKYKGKLTFKGEQIETLNLEKYRKVKGILERLKIAGEECGGNICTHPLKLVESKEYSLAQREELERDLKAFEKLLQALLQVYPEVMNLLEKVPKATYEALMLVKALMDRLNEPFYMPSKLLTNLDLHLEETEIKKAIAHIKSRRKLENSLLEDFDQAIFKYDAQGAQLLWRQADQSWVLPKVLGQNKLLKQLKAYGKVPSKVTKTTILGLYEELIAHSQHSEEIEKTSEKVVSHFDVLWKGVNSEASKLEGAYNKTIGLHECIRQITSERDKQQRLADALVETVIDQTYKELMDELVPLIEKFSTTYKINIDQTKAEANWLEYMLAQTKEILTHIEGLKAWSSFQKICAEAENEGIENVIKALRDGEVSTQELLPAFEGNLAMRCALYTIERVPCLMDFQGLQFEESIRRYKDTAKEFENLTIHELVANLSSKVPTSSVGIANSSEIGILQRAIKSGGRMLSIRKLFDSIPSLLRRLCPCMLMSPISVAQYIDTNYPKFDLVIFDEASQLPTCEAVGTIARGENVIVVGDPKQLPPTSFFSSNKVDEENFDKEDLESLLDDCLALTMPQEHLLWHYRSKHESLIAYSNLKYYDNKLFTFPSPNDLVSEVKLIPVEGFYDRGNSKQNKAEAEAVISELVRRLKDPILCKDSMGVVTFSSVQQNLIEDLLMEAFHLAPELEEINNSSEEPIFIKNLENVQGDERDVILFSIGYGPDKEGRVAMNFGPLNRDGGWRRLNVAISRARKSMFVYSTLKAEQIDLARTRSTGLEGLKGFLEFAARGKNMLAVNSKLNRNHQEGLESIVAERLRQIGYQVKCDIGCSEYKIDLGIVHPHKPDEYVLGIMCDGENYRLAGTAKDRNILQPSVLTALGWQLHRVWILDWLDNPDREIERIKNAIEIAIASKGSLKEVFSKSKLQFEQVDIQEKVDNNRKIYGATKIEPMGSAETFHLVETTPEIEKTIASIIEKEAPISRKLLSRKILNTWGITRTGAKVEARIDNILAGMKLKQSKYNEMLFYWQAEQNPNEYMAYRVPQDNETKRSMDDICEQEIANAIKKVINEQLSLSRMDLIREIAKLFGFTRIGNVIEVAGNGGIKAAMERGYIEVSEDGDKIKVAE